MTAVPATPEREASGIAHMQEVLRWLDGVTINMAMPAELFVSLGSWSVFGIEATASFVPEFKDTVRDALGTM